MINMLSQWGIDMIDKIKIKKLRADKAWSQKDLAGKCGVAEKTVSNWEQGRTGISGPALVILKGLIEGMEDKKD